MVQTVQGLAGLQGEAEEEGQRLVQGSVERVIEDEQEVLVERAEDTQSLLGSESCPRKPRDSASSGFWIRREVILAWGRVRALGREGCWQWQQTANICEEPDASLRGCARVSPACRCGNAGSRHWFTTPIVSGLVKVRELCNRAKLVVKQRGCLFSGEQVQFPAGQRSLI